MQDEKNSLREKIKDYFSNITIQAVVFLIIIACMFFVAFAQSEPTLDQIAAQVEAKTINAKLEGCLGRYCWEYEGPIPSPSEQSSGLYPVEVLDLHKQSVMAHWTVAIALFTLVGIVFVALTLFETRRSAKQMLAEQRDIGRKQVKAFLSVDSVVAQFMAKQDSETNTTQYSVEVDVMIKNSGASPAFGASIFFNPFLFFKDDDVGRSVPLSLRIEANQDLIAAQSDTPVTFTIKFPVRFSQKANSIVDKIQRGDIEFGVSVEMLYQDVFAKMENCKAVSYTYDHKEHGDIWGRTNMIRRINYRVPDIEGLDPQ